MSNAPIIAKAIKTDRQLREAARTLRDIDHATVEELREACEFVETHTRNADLLSLAGWARAIIRLEDTAAARRSV